MLRTERKRKYKKRRKVYAAKTFPYTKENLWNKFGIIQEFLEIFIFHGKKSLLIPI
jgi:hypothetical protein